MSDLYRSRIYFTCSPGDAFKTYMYSIGFGPTVLFKGYRKTVLIEIQHSRQFYCRHHRLITTFHVCLTPLIAAISTDSIMTCPSLMLIHCMHTQGWSRFFWQLYIWASEWVEETDQTVTAGGKYCILYCVSVWHNFSSFRNPCMSYTPFSLLPFPQLRQCTRNLFIL